MNIKDYLNQLKTQGIELDLHANGEDLTFRAKPGSLTSTIKARIGQLKPQIVQFLTETAGQDGIARCEQTDQWRLSAAQNRLWLQEQFHGAPNNLAGAVRLQGQLDMDRLEQALVGITQRHAVFRTRFSRGPDAQGYQHIEPSSSFALQQRDLSQSDQPFESACNEIKTQASRPFDLTQANLLRACVFKLGERDHLLFINMPHIVADGVSLQLFDRELGHGYMGMSIEESPVRYVDFAHWEANQPEDLSALAYWREQLQDAPVVSLGTDRLEQQPLYAASECSLILMDREHATRIKQFGAKRGCTPFMTLLAVFMLTLSRATGEPDVTVATAINNRAKPVLQSMIGFFLNILALRVKLHKATCFGDLLELTRQTCLDAYRHQSLPFDRIVEDLKPERIDSRNPIARIAFAVGDTPWMPGHTLGLPDIEISPVEIERGMLDFDMHLWVADQADGLTGRLEYRSDLFSKRTAKQFLNRFKIILNQLLTDLDGPLSKCDGLAPEERRWLQECLNPPIGPYQVSQSVLEVWRQIAPECPTNAALTCGHLSINYEQVDQRSDQLAAALMANGVHSGDVIALYLQPGIAMVVAMLACFKSGAAYLPIEVAIPDERLTFMLTDSNATLIISEADLRPELNTKIPVIDLHSSGMPMIEAALPKTWPTVSADDLAYVMYTSGSTGTPKGVRVPHRAIVRLVKDTNYVQIQPNDRIGQISNSAFDAFTFEIWGALLNGANVVCIARETVLDAKRLGDSLIDKQVSILFVTTALFNMLVRANPLALAKLRYLLFGGEQADVGLVRQYLHEEQPQTLLHVYGPTENTTFSTYYQVSSSSSITTHLPIGRPIKGTSAYVLSSDMALVLPGVTGELFLGGVGLADGYHHRPELTDEKFLSNPLALKTRLYRTGDRVRLNHDGELEFIGRTDNQIKLRGFRIELSEIESKLHEIHGVNAAFVTLHGSSDNMKIVAYIATFLDRRAIREALVGQLPNYMLPSVIICLPHLPINRNGKIDRFELPEPSLTDQGEIVAPRDAIEAKLASIWCEVIECPSIGVDDNFFDVGGHSLLATRVTARVSEQFGIVAELRSLFEHPSVAQYAQWLRGHIAINPTKNSEKIAIINRDEPIYLSSAQERLWFLDQMNLGSPAYNISYALLVQGPVSVVTLKAGFKALIKRHESLRTRFVGIDGQPYQEIVKDIDFDIEEIDFSSLTAIEANHKLEQHRLADALRPFQTSNAPLMRATLYQLEPQTWVLGLCLHHIIADGWSLGVLRRDLACLYDCISLGKLAELPELPIQYADYAHWDRSKRSDLEVDLAFWKNELQDLPALRLPTDHQRPERLSFRGAAQRFTIGAATTRALRCLSAQHSTTLFMTLLAGFSILLQRYSRQDDFAVGTPIAHRNHLDTENLIGFFVNTLVMRCQLDSDQSFVEHLQKTRRTALAAYAHQDMPFERLVQALDPERDPTTNPLVQVIFALQNAPASQQQIENIRIEPLEYLVATTRFDLEMHLWEGDDLASGRDEISGILVYDTALFQHENMARLCRCFEALLQSICAHPEAPISELDAVSQQDRKQALSASYPMTDYPRHQSIVDLFNEQARAYPDKAALLLEDRVLSYRDLDSQSSQLARQLIACGLKAESAVVLKLKPSFAYFVSMLAVLKAGGCYVPVDPCEPTSRLAQMLESVKPYLTIDQTQFDQFLTEQPQAESPLEPVSTTSESLAYIMFTSGSTGAPKGVRIEHRAVVRLVKDTNFHSFGSDEVWLQAASLTFDASTLEIWGALLNGASLAVVPDSQAAFAEIGATVRRHGVTSMWLTAGLFNSIVDTELDSLQSVRHLIAGGDVLSMKHVQKAQNAFPTLKLTNGYGPTENTTFTCCYAIDKTQAIGATIPIGKPIANTSAYIVDEHLRIVADGMPGELVTGGDGLARDYLDSSELTASRFVKNPFVTDPKARVYRTGDLVRRNAQGEIEFLGRIDNQIKIRGYRVETGEIEEVLCRHAQVEAAAIKVDTQGEHKRLIAYVVPAMPEKSTGLLALGQEQVKDWETLFDGSLYQNLNTHLDPTFNTAGWKSSTTNKEIPSHQMKDWLDDFVDTINRHPHADVLEIGCGTGMVLFRLAPFCKSYVGTDFSAQALDHIKKHLPKESPVSLYQCEALDLSGFSTSQFDTVILNSVVQYFPDIDYLNKLIEQCLPLIKDDGRLIIGDIRHLPLLRAFHAGVTFARSHPQLRVRQWRSIVDQALLEEDELVISPSYFSTLEMDRIASVSFRLQRPSHDNELSKFRYTAIIEIGKAKANREYPELSIAAPHEVEQFIECNKPDSFILRALSNPRVGSEVALVSYLENPASQATPLAALGRQIEQQKQAGFDPDVWWQLGEKLGYQVDVAWTDDNAKGAYDVLFVAKQLAHGTIGIAGRSDGGSRANQPLRGKLARALGPKLREHCKQYLPDYMLPAHFVMLPVMPLTKTGKLDKRALYSPQSFTKARDQHPKASANETESRIAKIWGELLGLADPGVTDNFFDLGGHSLLMVQVCNRLQAEFGQKVPVLTMFQYPTIRALAQALDQTTHPTKSSNTNTVVDRARKQRERIEQRAAQQRTRQ